MNPNVFRTIYVERDGREIEVEVGAYAVIENGRLYLTSFRSEIDLSPDEHAHALEVLSDHVLTRRAA